MNYVSFILKLLPKKLIALYLLKEFKILVEKTDNDIDNELYYNFLYLLTKIGFISEKDTINEKL